MNFFTFRSRKKSASRPALAGRFRAIAGSLKGDGQARIYWLLIAYLTVVFFIGGASRYDVQSLTLLRPLAVLVGGYALLTLRWSHVRSYGFLFIMAGLIFGLTALHLVPLPPALWQALPGRDIVVDVDQAAGIANIWRPLTMTPGAGTNALFSLFVPMAALFLAVQLATDQLKRLVLPILLLGALSAVIGIFQVAGDPAGPLYFYRVTNNGSAVGLFSNRNHQAVFLLCLIPLIAFFASQSMKTEQAIKLRLAVAIGAVALLIPLILVTGSRLGIILGLVAILLGYFIYKRPHASGARRRTERKNYTIPVFSVLGGMVLVLVTVMASRAEGLQRLFGMSLAEEERTQAWSRIVEIIGDYMPVGSGAGSFVEIYQLVEPIASLSPVYFNHAHNDILEVVLTFGLPGLALIVFAIVGYVIAVRPVLRRGVPAGSDLLLARAGAAVLLLIALSSIVDYPLRTPSLTCLFVLACCWLRAGSRNLPISAGAR